MEDTCFDQLKLGNERVLSTYFNRHGRALLLFAYRIVADASLAEELVQDAYVKLWAARHRLESDAHIKSFLYHTTKNACIDHLRGTNYRMQTVSGELPDESGIQTDSDLLARMIHAETLQLVYAEVKKLSPTQQQVFKLTFVEGLTTEEICTQLEMTANAVFIARSKALATLKRVFKDTDLFLYLTFYTLMERSADFPALA